MSESLNYCKIKGSEVSHYTCCHVLSFQLRMKELIQTGCLPLFAASYWKLIFCFPFCLFGRAQKQGLVFLRKSPVNFTLSFFPPVWINTAHKEWIHSLFRSLHVITCCICISSELEKVVEWRSLADSWSERCCVTALLMVDHAAELMLLWDVNSNYMPNTASP